MTFEYYWSLLMKQWKLIVACIVVVGLGAYIGSRLTTPIYQSTVLVRVDIRSTDNSADYNSLLASDQLVQTEAQLATSGPVLREVASHYPGLSVDQLAAATKTAPRLNTQLFEIDVENASPARAAALANDIASTLIKQQVQETQQGNSRSQQQLQQEVDATRQRIDAITSRIIGLQQQMTNLEFQKGSQSQVAVLQAQVTGLQNQLNGLQEHYNQWQASLLQLEMNEAQGSNFLRVVQPAQPAMYPVKPRILLNTMIGLGAGLLLALILTLLLEQLDTRVRTPEELSQLFNWPVLGTIWRAKGVKDQQGVLVSAKEHSINIEPYRILRTNIGFSAVQRPVHTLMVTSAMPNDGKSTIAANLAAFMARAGKKTLLVDADLRRPTLHKKFMLAADQMGISNAILAFSQLPSATVGSGERSAAHAISLLDYMHPVDVPNLLVMPAGPLPPNPPELLDSKAVDNLLAVIAGSDIEMVIFDTPPLLGLSDASILLPKMDGVLLVVDITRAKRRTLGQMKDLLAQTGARVLGCVVNKQYPNRRGMPYYYYYYSHGDHRADGEQEKHAPQNGHGSRTLSSSVSLASPPERGEQIR